MKTGNITAYLYKQLCDDKLLLERMSVLSIFLKSLEKNSEIQYFSLAET